MMADGPGGRKPIDRAAGGTSASRAGATDTVAPTADIG
jgi:hypothetical protein